MEFPLVGFAGGEEDVTDAAGSAGVPGGVVIKVPDRFEGGGNPPCGGEFEVGGLDGEDLVMGDCCVFFKLHKYG